MHQLFKNNKSISLFFNIQVSYFSNQQHNLLQINCKQTCTMPLPKCIINNNSMVNLMCHDKMLL